MRNPEKLLFESSFGYDDGPTFQLFLYDRMLILRHKHGDNLWFMDADVYEQVFPALFLESTSQKIKKQVFWFLVHALIGFEVET